MMRKIISQLSTITRYQLQKTSSTKLPLSLDQPDNKISNSPTNKFQILEEKKTSTNHKIKINRRFYHLRVSSDLGQ